MSMAVEPFKVRVPVVVITMSALPASVPPSSVIKPLRVPVVYVLLVSVWVAAIRAKVSLATLGSVCTLAAVPDTRSRITGVSSEDMWKPT